MLEQYSEREQELLVKQNSQLIEAAVINSQERIESSEQTNREIAYTE